MAKIYVPPNRNQEVPVFQRPSHFPARLEPIAAYQMRPQYYPPGGYMQGTERSLKKKMLPPLTDDGQPWFEPQPQKYQLRKLNNLNKDCTSFPANGWEGPQKFVQLQYYQQPGAEYFGNW